MRALFVIAVLALAVPAAADPLPPEAQKHLDAGLALFDKAQYDAASAEFEAAYKIEPASRLLFALAQSKRLGGHCDEAMPLYRKYLATLPSEAQTTAANAGMALCEKPAQPATTTATDPDQVKPPAGTDDPPVVVAPPVVATPVTAPLPETIEGEHSRPWYRRHPIGASLIAGGAIGVGVGSWFLVSARNAKNRAEDAELRDDFLDAIDRANSRRRIGIGVLVVGGVLITAGVLEIVLHHDRRDRKIAAGTDGTTVYLRAAF